MGQKRVSRVAQEYAGRQLQVGDTFECDAEHVGLLLAMGRVEREEGDPPAPNFGLHRGEPSQTYRTRDLKAKQHTRKAA